MKEWKEEKRRDDENAKKEKTCSVISSAKKNEGRERERLGCRREKKQYKEGVKRCKRKRGKGEVG